jgi:hypothetical protein
MHYHNVVSRDDKLRFDGKLVPQGSFPVNLNSDRHLLGFHTL